MYSVLLASALLAGCLLAVQASVNQQLNKAEDAALVARVQAVLADGVPPSMPQPTRDELEAALRSPPQPVLCCW